LRPPNPPRERSIGFLLQRFPARFIRGVGGTENIAMSKRKLGRGLQALLGNYEDSSEGGVDVAPPPGELSNLPLFDLEPNPFQPRQDYDPAELASLAQSIQQHGVLQPILVRQHEGRYQIVAGERRFRAAQEAGLSRIPVRILELDDQQMFAFALVENLQRQDLNAIEKAQAFQEYIGRFAVTHEQLAQHVGVDRSTVTNLVRLLELPDAIQQMVRQGRITFGHARAIIGVADPEVQMRLAERIQSEGLSVRQIEALVREPNPVEAPAIPKPSGRKPVAKSAHILSLESDLRRRFGAKVEIKPKATDRGAIMIYFSSNEEFERLMDSLGGAA
jgi:ParB family chromosome partitioning protein